MIISTPNWNQEFPDLVPQANGDGSDGEDGKDGKDGPHPRTGLRSTLKVEVFERFHVPIFSVE